jgi:hypothetical protein
MPQLTTTASLVTSSHTGAPSLTISSHVGYWSMTSESHVEDLQPAVVLHTGDIALVAMSHIDITSPTSIHHVGEEPPASASHVESMSPTIVNDVGGIHTIEKPIRVRFKPKLLCRTCEGNHLTRLFPVVAGIPEAWFSPAGPFGF